MIDRPTEADVMAAVDRDDYAWLVKHVFVPAMVQIMREDHTAALMNGSPRPRSRLLIDAGRRHSHRQARRFTRFRHPPG
jgi:hypothetical protein